MSRLLQSLCIGIVAATALYSAERFAETQHWFWLVAFGLQVFLARGIHADEVPR